MRENASAEELRLVEAQKKAVTEGRMSPVVHKRSLSQPKALVYVNKLPSLSSRASPNSTSAPDDSSHPKQSEEPEEQDSLALKEKASSPVEQDKATPTHSSGTDGQEEKVAASEAEKKAAHIMGKAKEDATSEPVKPVLAIEEPESKEIAEPTKDLMSISAAGAEPRPPSGLLPMPAMATRKSMFLTQGAYAHCTRINHVCGCGVQCASSFFFFFHNVRLPLLRAQRASSIGIQKKLRESFRPDQQQLQDGLKDGGAGGGSDIKEAEMSDEELKKAQALLYQSFHMTCQQGFYPHMEKENQDRGLVATPW